MLRGILVLTALAGLVAACGDSDNDAATSTPVPPATATSAPAATEATQAPTQAAAAATPTALPTSAPVAAWTHETFCSLISDEDIEDALGSAVAASTTYGSPSLPGCHYVGENGLGIRLEVVVPLSQVAGSIGADQYQAIIDVYKGFNYQFDELDDIGNGGVQLTANAGSRTAGTLYIASHADMIVIRPEPMPAAPLDAEVPARLLQFAQAIADDLKR